MRTVKEVSKITGVSVRTLHHYDAIGLLKPSKVTEAGYRLYDDTALGRLQSILLFRELQFSLKEIKEILDRPNFELQDALSAQIELLEMQRNHLENLISFARNLQKNGGNDMSFEVFDKREIEQYKREAKEKWGSTKAFQEYEQREKNGGDFGETANQMMQVFVELGALKDLKADDQVVQAKIEALRTFITEHYYHCTKEILQGLGQMYVGDERFKKNIDKAGGEGTAEFVKEAIDVYCK